MKTSLLLFACYFLLTSCQKERNGIPLYEPSLTRQININALEMKAFHRTGKDRTLSVGKSSLQEKSEPLRPELGKPSQWR